MWTKLIALAVTIPLTITIASAQASQDADIAAYSQDLQMRISRGHQSGQLTQANYNSVQNLYNQVEMIRRGLGNRAMNPVVRMNMMNSLTNLDKQLTGYLHDDVNSRYQMWDPSRKSWRNNWWQADTSGASSFNSEIDAYQNSLKQRIDQGRQNGRITRAELAQLTTSYENVDRAQQQYRIGGFSSWERNSLMSMLTQLDKDITAQMHDDEKSHYKNWNANNKGWSNNWWQADTSGANDFNSEIDAYQNSLKARIDKGRQSGQITRAELAQLTTSYDNVDSAQQQYRIGGFNSSERNSLMSMLTQLDKDITAQMHDDENSHYRNWNANTKGWNNSWWKNANTNVNTNANTNSNTRDGRPGDWNNRGDSNNRDWNRGDSNRNDATSREWNRGDGVRNNSNTKDWNGGNSNRGGWNNRAGFSESNESIKRSSEPSTGATAGDGSATGGDKTKIYNTPPRTGGSATTNNPPPVSPPPTTPPPSATPPAATNNPPAGTGSPNTGTTAGEGRRGNWGGEGRGERTGEGRGDRSGTWERSRQSNP